MATPSFIPLPTSPNRRSNKKVLSYHAKVDPKCPYGFRSIRSITAIEEDEKSEFSVCENCFRPKRDHLTDKDATVNIYRSLKRGQRAKE